MNERKYWLGKIKTKSSYEIGKFILFSVLFLFFATIITFPALFLNTGQQQSKKACIFAGHTSGSISDYRLEVYEDSTYYLSSFLNSKKNKWIYKLDTLMLLDGNKTCAKIINSKLFEFYCDSFKSLSIMNERKFSPPIVVKYPTPN